MDTQITDEQSVRSVAVGGNSGTSKAYCKCGEGWKCVITRTEGPDSGKAFFKCGENCTCVVAGDGTVKGLEKIGPNEAYCECGEGWTCVISKVKGSEADKAFFECADGCSCATTA
ncbi:hypothetical protein ACLB2K_006255 [Fragaria x ananassa]